MLPNYDGQSDLKQLVATFDAMVQSFKGDTAVLAKSLVMTIQGIAQTWYMSLKPGSISSWQQLKEALYANFQGFHMQPVTSQALFACKQEPGESLQSYVRRFLNMKAQIAGISDEVVINTAIKDLRIGTCANKFARKHLKTVQELCEKLYEHYRGDNDLRLRQQEIQQAKEVAQHSQQRQQRPAVSIPPSYSRPRDRNVHNIKEGKVEPKQEASEYRQSETMGQTQYQSPPNSYRGGYQSSSYRGGYRGRGGRGPGGRPQRKLYCVFCGEDKGHTTKYCHITIQKKKELGEKTAQEATSNTAQSQQYCPVNYSIPNIQALTYGQRQALLPPPSAGTS